MKAGITPKTLAAHLQEIHPANFAAGALLLREWALAEFHDGQEPTAGKGHPLFEAIAEFHAGWSRRGSSHPECFALFLEDYSRLLHAARDYCRSAADAACDQLARIGHGLDLEMVA